MAVPSHLPAGLAPPAQRHHGAAVPYPVDPTNTNAQIVGGTSYLMGWAVRNTSATAGAAFSIWSGTQPAGVKAFPVNLAANESSREWFGPDGVWMVNGVTFNIESGAVEGSVMVAEPQIDPHS